MPSILITTSRRTSNRVRSFIRDLSNLFPNSERFNRGGMSFSEIVSRIRQSGAIAAFIVTMQKGNPNTLRIIQPDGTELLTLIIESAKLRREVSSNRNLRINGIHSISIKSGCSKKTQRVADVIASLLDMTLIVSEKPEVHKEKTKGVLFWFQDLPSDKVLWTHFHSEDESEIGPRIRITSIKG